MGNIAFLDITLNYPNVSIYTAKVGDMLWSTSRGLMVVYEIDTKYYGVKAIKCIDYLGHKANVTIFKMSQSLVESEVIAIPSENMSLTDAKACLDIADNMIKDKSLRKQGMEIKNKYINLLEDGNKNE